MLQRGELLLRLGPFVVRLKTNVASLAVDVASMYADFFVCSSNTFADFHIEVARDAGVRAVWRPQVRFFFDGQPSFIPLPTAQAIAMLEWGLNWCIAAHAHHYLVIHAAVVEKNGKAALLPAPPGSGKSTLCAGLVSRGWRLLSDELGLYDTKTGLVYGMSRPMNLKNESIHAIQQFEPTSVMTPSMPNTTKGTVALVRPPPSSVACAAEPARVQWIVLPTYTQNALPVLQPHSRARTLMLLAEQSFNYSIHGESGFDMLSRLVDQSWCYQFTYSQLDDAVRTFEMLLSESTS